MSTMTIPVKMRLLFHPRYLKRALILLFIGLFALIILLTLIVIVRVIYIQMRKDPGLQSLRTVHLSDSVDDNRMKLRADRLAGALKIPTVSYKTDKQNKEALLQLHTYLEKNFPLVHSNPSIKREIVNGYSLLYTVKGTADNEGQLPYLLASHLDVVPAENTDAWEVPPFSGKVINDTYVYGRGAMDDKSGVLGIMEALEYALEISRPPARSFYIAFGHDEEVSGKRGAQELAKALRARGVKRLDFVLDEGFPVVQSIFPGTDRPIALVGVSEKGSATLEVTVNGRPGHSSMPPTESAIGILSTAISRLEHSPQPSMLGRGPEKGTFESLAPHVSLLYKIIYSNVWLFSGLMARLMSKNPMTNAFVRTTTAITIFHGGIKENVVPPNATAVINLRIHPCQTVDDVVKITRETMADPRVNIKVRRAMESHPVSPHGLDSIPYNLVSSTIKQIYSDAIVAPSVFIANTDTRWYLSLSEHLFRFLPTVIFPEDVNRYHGNNERVSIKHYHQSVKFYYRIIRNADMVSAIKKTTSRESIVNEL